VQAKARIGQSDESLILGEDQPFLLPIIASAGVASNVHHYEQQATALAAIKKNHRVLLWEAKGAQLWVSKGTFVAPVCTPLKHSAHSNPWRSLPFGNPHKIPKQNYQ
jgi:hypothetical protein